METTSIANSTSAHFANTMLYLVCHRRQGMSKQTRISRRNSKLLIKTALAPNTFETTTTYATIDHDVFTQRFQWCMMVNVVY